MRNFLSIPSLLDCLNTAANTVLWIMGLSVFGTTALFVAAMLLTFAS